MLSVQQSYSRLFRPWDISEDRKQSETTTLEDEKRKRKSEEKRENRLRKIRGHFRKAESVHQDATVSTTTEEEIKTELNPSPVENLTSCCDRLLEEPKVEMKPVKAPKHFPKPPVTPTDQPTKHYPEQMIPNVMPGLYSGYPDYLSTDIAHALGVPPTDPLLLESLAQGYAMELEYARILQQENEAKLLNSRKQRPKKYKCPHCQVGFSNNGQLKGHIRIHTGERPYKCEEKNCGKTFTRNEELTRHKRIHSGVRPFPCPTCGKKFGRRDHLKKHTRTHYMQAERMMPVFVPLSAVPHGFPYLYGY